MDATTTTKIQTHHLERLAGIYVRQSSLHQVRTHTASTQLQYDLRARAIYFGWSSDRVRIYDADLGIRGSVPGERQDFHQMVADVGLRRIGIILAFDVTRLARNNADWYRLLDMCGICEALVADLDGVYDMSSYNDRLVLGLKGTMSEAEHHLMRTRLHEGMKKKAASGELRRRLPVGLEYADDGAARLHSDEAVRHAIELVFAKFQEMGTGHQVYRYLQAEKLLLPSRRYSWSEVRWQKPHYQAVHDILTNPRYAGAYVYGRTVPTRAVDPEGRIQMGRKEVPPSEWKVLIKDHCPGYISWEQFEENQKRLQKNTLMRRTGEASAVLRNGRALLQGLLRCGICGRRMSPAYPANGDSIRYACQKQMYSTEGPSVCQSVGGVRLDRAVTDAFLDAMQPASIEIAVAALEEMEATVDVGLQQLEDQLQEARYQAGRARRQYNAVEPENRNVARTLEAEWNRRLLQVSEIEDNIAKHRDHRPAATLSASERTCLLELGADLRRAWEAPTTTVRDKKQLLQTAFETVFVRVDRTARVALLTLVWEGGSTTELAVQLPRVGQHRNTDEQHLIEEVRKMATGMSDKQIARTLSARAVSTTMALPFTAERVRRFRKRHGIEEFRPDATISKEEVYTAQQAARELGVNIVTILRWLKEGFLEGVQLVPYAPWRIKLPQSVRLKTAEQTPEGWLSIRSAAHVLGVSTRTVLHWVQEGRLEAMIGGRGRRRGLRIKISSIDLQKQRSLFDAKNG
jgi:excisionase family DNA binding protein